MNRRFARQPPRRHRNAGLAFGLLVPVALAVTVAGAVWQPGNPLATREPGASPEAVRAATVRSGGGQAEDGQERPLGARITWRRSRAIGLPNAGRLAGGVQLPAEGTQFVTWDPVRRVTPNRGWRRWGTDRLVRLILRVAQDDAVAHPGAPRLVVGDLSRPRGGDFGPRFGGDGHASHQNGLDVDIYYPRRDGLERAPTAVTQIDRRRAQELVDRFVQAGAVYVFVGPTTGLRGPRPVVAPLGNHHDHMHVRIRPDRRPRTRR